MASAPFGRTWHWSPVTFTLCIAMSAWRRKALELLPGERKLIAVAESPMALWIDMHLAFEDAVRKGDEKKLNAILEYAAWCISPAAGPLPSDASTAAVCAFYEHIAAKKDYWPRLREWLSPDQFKALEGHLNYFLSETEFDAMRKTYYARSRHA
jgi:hypothetical protein